MSRKATAQAVPPRYGRDRTDAATENCRPSAATIPTGNAPGCPADPMTCRKAGTEVPGCMNCRTLRPITWSRFNPTNWQNAPFASTISPSLCISTPSEVTSSKSCNCPVLPALKRALRMNRTTQTAASSTAAAASGKTKPDVLAVARNGVSIVASLGVEAS